jgi:hypothetical protein
MKPHEPKKREQNKNEKGGGKQRAIKNQNKKRRTDNKTLNKKMKMSGKNLTKAIKRRNQRSRFRHMNC